MSKLDKNDRGSETLKHFVSDAPFDPYLTDELTPEQARFYMASQWQLMWWKFARHRLALISGAVLLLMS